MSTSPSRVPTTARVASLTQWSNLFHPARGVFRHPSTEGETIEHLDIDLRYIDHGSDSHDGSSSISTVEPISLPGVCRLILRGAEHVQDSDERIGCLSEVLDAINPVEVQW